MWLSDISPLRAGTVGSLSDNNLAEINVPIFASSVNRFLTFSSKRTIFGVFYSFPVHNYVISTKNKLPLAVYFPVSYTEIGARIRVINHEASSKIMLVCYFLLVLALSSCPTIPSGTSKTSVERAKRGHRHPIRRRKIGGQPVILRCPHPKPRQFCSDIRTYRVVQPDIRTHLLFPVFPCGTHRNSLRRCAACPVRHPGHPI